MQSFNIVYMFLQKQYTELFASDKQKLDLPTVSQFVPEANFKMLFWQTNSQEYCITYSDFKQNLQQITSLIFFYLWAGGRITCLMVYFHSGLLLAYFWVWLKQPCPWVDLLVTDPPNANSNPLHKILIIQPPNLYHCN